MYLLSDSVSPEDRALYGELAIETLDLLVLWDRLLDDITWFLREWRLEQLAEDVEQTPPSKVRIRDVDRRDDFLRIASEANVSGNRSNFKAVFNRVMAARHHVAHAMAMNAMTSNGKARIGIPFYAGNPRISTLDKGKSQITMSLVKKRKREAEWLIEHVEWARTSKGQFGGPLASAEPRDAPPTAMPRQR